MLKNLLSVYYLAIAFIVKSFPCIFLKTCFTCVQTHFEPKIMAKIHIADLIMVIRYSTDIFAISERQWESCKHTAPCTIMTSSNEHIFRVTSPFVRGIHLTKASDAEHRNILWYAPRINGWVNNREAGELRRHRAHYDVILMSLWDVIGRMGKWFNLTHTHSTEYFW